MAAVGTLTLTQTFIRTVARNRDVFKLAWTSDATGAVSGQDKLALPPGAKLVQAKFVPGTGGDQPTNLYDITVKDADGADVLADAGANLSNATAKYSVPAVEVCDEGGKTLDFVVANAGDTKKGVCVLVFG